MHTFRSKTPIENSSIFLLNDGSNGYEPYIATFLAISFSGEDDKDLTKEEYLRIECANDFSYYEIHIDGGHYGTDLDVTWCYEYSLLDMLGAHDPLVRSPDFYESVIEYISTPEFLANEDILNVLRYYHYKKLVFHGNEIRGPLNVRSTITIKSAKSDALGISTFPIGYPYKAYDGIQQCFYTPTRLSTLGDDEVLKLYEATDVWLDRRRQDGID